MSRNQAATKRKIVDILAETPIASIACQKLSIARATYYRWREDDPAFAKECDKAIKIGSLRINDLAESHIIRRIQEGDQQAAMYWLNNRSPNYAMPSKLVREIFIFDNPDRLLPIPLLLGGLAPAEVEEDVPPEPKDIEPGNQPPNPEIQPEA